VNFPSRQGLQNAALALDSKRTFFVFLNPNACRNTGKNKRRFHSETTFVF
jgi:hypothetical protein